MICQDLISVTNKKPIINLLSAECAHRVVTIQANEYASKIDQEVVTSFPKGGAQSKPKTVIPYVCIAFETETAITKTYLYNFDPLKPHFYIVKLGFRGVYIMFLISAQKHRLRRF